MVVLNGVHTLFIFFSRKKVPYAVLMVPLLAHTRDRRVARYHPAAPAQRDARRAHSAASVARHAQGQWNGPLGWL